MTEEAWVDREAFRTWLVAKDPNEVVGRAGHAAGCPLACYAQDVLGLERAEVAGVGMAPAGDWEGDDVILRRNPRWAERFVHVIDGLGSIYRFDDCPEVNAKQALTILDDIDA